MLSGPESKRKKYFPIYPTQAEFLDSQEPIRGFVGGIGSGKSFVGCYDVLTRAKSGRLYLVCAPTYVMLRDATLRSFFDVCERLELAVKWSKADHIARLPKGAEIIFRTADNSERLRGPNLSGAYLDEASLMPEQVFSVVLGRLRQGNQVGWLSATFTPKGLTHWTYDVFGKGRPGVKLCRARTLDNYFLTEDYYHNVKAQYGTSLTLQELEGQFVSQDGVEWPPEYFNDSIWFRDWPHDLTCKSIGLDPSKGRSDKVADPKKNREGDYSAFVLLGRSQNGTLYCEADMNNRRTAERIVDDGIELQRIFNADVFAVETNNFQELLAAQMLEVSRHRGIQVPIVPYVNTAPKQVRIRRLGPYLAAGTIRFRDTEGTRLLVNQLRDFPLAQFDDGPDALELALRGMTDFWNESSEPEYTVFRE